MSDTKPDKKEDKKSRTDVILFALLLSFICSLLISVAAVGLKGFQKANIELDRKVNVLKAVNLAGKEKPSRKKINQLYDKHIKEVRVNTKGKIIEEYSADSLKLYFFQQNGRIKGYVLPINTRGLWGKIQGYLAFESDGMTVSGFSVFSHSETPGLGGEIESAWFRKNFQGKKILNSENKFVSIGIAKGKVQNLPEKKQVHFVDGISGATLTGRYLSEGIKKTLVKYEPLSITFRQKTLKEENKVK